MLTLWADSHVLSEYGLILPGTCLWRDGPDGKPVAWELHPNPLQERLWEIYSWGMEGAIEFAGRDEMILIVAGDIGEGNKYIDNLETQRPDDQVVACTVLLREWLKLKNLKALRLATGTPAHNLGRGSLESAIARELRLEFPPSKKDIAAVSHALDTVGDDGFRVDYTHRGPGASRYEWTKGDVARRYLRDMMIRDMLAGEVPPQLVVRAHNHDIVTEQYTQRTGSRYCRSELIVLPPMCLPNEHAQAITQGRSVVVTNGIVCYEIINGELGRRREFIRTTDMRSRGKL